MRPAFTMTITSIADSDALQSVFEPSNAVTREYHVAPSGVTFLDGNMMAVKVPRLPRIPTILRDISSE